MSEDKGDKWEMPKPVFRTTTGALPKSLEDTIHESTFPSADTVEINKETVEIDADTLEIGEDTMQTREDEDILSLHDSPPADQPEEAEDYDGETTLTMDSDASESEPVSETKAETKPEAAPEAEPAPSQEPAIAGTVESQPPLVPAKHPAANIVAKKSGAGTFLYVIIGLALVVGLIVVAVLYYLFRH